MGETNGRLYEPRQVPVGKACGCVCPGCQSPLIAIHAPSGKVAPHFKHAADVECTTGVETALHLAAKQLIKEEQKLWFPALAEDFCIQDALGVEHRSPGMICHGGLDLLISVTVEPWLDSIRPDILATAMLYDEVLIEIAVTHRVTPEKRAKIKASNRATLEVVLSDLQPLSLSALAGALFKPSERISWLHHPQTALRERAFKERMRPVLKRAEMAAAERFAREKALAAARHKTVEWQAAPPENPKQFDGIAEVFCRKNGVSVQKLRQLLGASRHRINKDYAYPEQAAVAMARLVGGDERSWLNFLCYTGLAKET